MTHKANPRPGIVNAYRLKPDGKLVYLADTPVDEYCGLFWKALGDIPPVNPMLAYVGVTHSETFDQQKCAYLKVVSVRSGVLT